MDMTSDGLETKAGAGSDVGALFAEFSRAFEDFKATNDQRLKEIEKRGSADGLIEGKLERLNAVLDGQKAAMDRVLVERARPLLDGKAAQVDGEYKEAFSAYVKRGEEKALSVGTNALDAQIVQNNMLPLHEVSLVSNKARTGIELPSVAVDVPAGKKLFLTVSPISDMSYGHGSRVPGAFILKNIKVNLPVR